MTRSRLVFDRLAKFPSSEMGIVIPFVGNIHQSIKPATDLTRLAWKAVVEIVTRKPVSCGVQFSA